MIALDRQQELIRLTMRLAAEASAAGDLPFACLLVTTEGDIIIKAKNTVNSTHSEAAHAEINMLFEAGEQLGTGRLGAYAVITNAAPCPMCMTALIKAEVISYYFGAPNEKTMVPNIPMADIIATLPFKVAVYGNILGEECAEQIRQLARRE